MAAFTMPSLGADMDEGKLLEWLVRPGDTVRKGDIVAVVDTAKAAIEVETFIDGVVSELLVEPGTTVPVGAPLATIEPAGRAAAPPPPRQVPADIVTAPVPESEPVPVPAVRSPLVRRLAEQLGVDLAHVQGTGRGGTITRDDVTRAAAAQVVPSPAAAPPTRVRATPYARKLAAELGLDLTSLRHPDGEPVTADDVRAARAGATSAPTPAESVPAESVPAKAQSSEPLARAP
jgi:pyruvate/2-oxoglutarate dehydrogenase complex dihydrolipoamide acyltransferase (E2) component